MSKPPWKPGYVLSHDWLYLRLEPGRVWEYYLPDEPQPLRLRLISTSPEGEVVLRPENAEQAKAAFPMEEFVKGGPSKCPFKQVDARMAAASKGQYQEGDLLCHEAWHLWSRMG